VSVVGLKDEQILGFCNKNHIQLPISWRHSLNAVRYHDRRETDNHFFFKARIAFELMKRGQTVFTELKLSNRHEQPVADLFWLDEKIVVEFESEYNAEKKQKKLQQYFLFNCLVFDIKVPEKDFESKVKEIKDKLGLV
jgi:hypothetical protein